MAPSGLLDDRAAADRVHAGGREPVLTTGPPPTESRAPEVLLTRERHWAAANGVEGSQAPSYPEAGPGRHQRSRGGASNLGSR